MSVHTRERICAGCQRWVAQDRIGYVRQDQYDSRHQYALCPQCLALGMVLELWLARRYGLVEPAVVVRALQAVLATLPAA